MTDAAHLLEPIRALHERIRDAVVAACTRQTSELLAAVASDAAGDGDTIYAIDRVGEDMLVQGLADVAREEPLCLMAEGLPGEGLVLPRGAREQAPAAVLFARPPPRGSTRPSPGSPSAIRQSGSSRATSARPCTSMSSPTRSMA